MRIAIDGRAIQPAQDGIGRYSRCIIEHLCKLDKTNEYFVFVMQEVFDFEKYSNFNQIINKHRYVNQYTILWFHRILHQLKIDILFSPFFFSPPHFRGKSVLTVHDLIWLYMPELQARPWHPVDIVKKMAHRIFVPLSIRNASEIITVSAATAADLHRNFPELKSRITAIHLGIDHLAKVDNIVPLSQREPYILFVGNSKPYKNMSSVIACFAQLTERTPFLDWRLKIPGRLDDHRAQIQNQISRSSCRDRVDLLGPVSEAALLELYSQAKLLLFPSRYEGFGFPVLEAMSCGTPVVCSTSSSLPEIAGDCAVLVDAEDRPGIVRACHDLLLDPARMQDLATRGLRHAKSFCWEACARQTLEVLLRVGESVRKHQ